MSCVPLLCGLYIPMASAPLALAASLGQLQIQEGQGQLGQLAEFSNLFTHY